MRREALQDFAPTGDGLDEVCTISGSAFHLFKIASEQLIFTGKDMLARNAGLPEGFFNDLQIRHPGNHHAVQGARGAKDASEHRHRVVLEDAVALAAHQGAVEIPEQNAHRVISKWRLK